MDKVLFAIAYIVTVILILGLAFILINANFNNDHLDELEEGAMIKLGIKKQLLIELHNWITDNNLNKVQIGEKLAISRKTIANILYQRADNFTIDTLIDLVLRTGKNITFIISE